MQLGLRAVQKQIQTQKPTLQQLQYYRLLQQTNLELEQDILDEVNQNPALEVEEVTKCPRCGEIIMPGNPCTTCLSSKADDADREPIRSETLDMMEEIYQSTQGQYEASTYEAVSDEDLPDAFATKVRAITLEDHLKHRLPLDCFDFNAEERIIAEDIIDRIDAGSESEVDDASEIEKGAREQAKLDNPGFIKLSDEALASEFSVDVELLRIVRLRIAMIDPIGSGLQSSVDVLALQAELDESLDDPDREALRKIILHHLEDISKEKFARVSKVIGIPTKRVKELIEHAKRSYHMHPRRMFEESESNAEVENPYITADVRIREIDGQYIAEVLDSGLPQLRLNRFYIESYQKLKKDRMAFNRDERSHIKEYFERATSYIQNLNARRQTMLDITEEIIKEQEAYLRYGPLYLKKLTRKEIAEKIGVHPSTVSRALAVRYCWLPDNSIVPFSVFFNPALCYIEMIRQILHNESYERVFSDEEIRDMMAEKGHDLSRRVITKYRKKGKIPPSGRRKRNLVKEWKKSQADGEYEDMEEEFENIEEIEDEED
ncbi:MAG TPA: hypothetical protein VGB30_14030 [bacterium]|jgi:RNA polymerase sigma-54 factor